MPTVRKKICFERITQNPTFPYTYNIQVLPFDEKYTGIIIYFYNDLEGDGYSKFMKGDMVEISSKQVFDHFYSFDYRNKLEYQYKKNLDDYFKLENMTTPVFIQFVDKFLRNVVIEILNG